MNKDRYKSKIEEFGALVKKVRENQGKTQQRLADDCEVDLRTIQRIEKGEYGPGLHVVYALADALEVQPYYLFSKV